MIKSAKTSDPNPKATRDRKSVETRLIASACRLLSEQGPRAVTIRDIAQNAGVNHGQIHHYFGSKQGLLIAAMRQLANEHAEHAAQRAVQNKSASLTGIRSNPPPLTLAEDKHYQMAVLRCVLDGQIELATQEIENGVCVPRQVLDEVTEALDQKQDPVDIKAALAVAMCIEHAWAALDQYILDVIDAQPDEVEAIQKVVARESRSLLSQLLDKNK